MIENFKQEFGRLKASLFPNPRGAELIEPSIGPAAYAGSVLINLFALALPITVLQIYDRVLPNAAFGTLTLLIAALVGVVIFDAVLKYCRSYLINWAAASYAHRLYMKALGAMMATAPSRHAAIPESEHLDRLNAIPGLGGYLGGQSRLIAVDLCFIPLFAGVILLIGGPIFIVPIALFAVFGYHAMRRTKRLCAIIEEREKSDARKYDFVIEILQSIQTVKSLAMEPLMMRRFERLQSAESAIVQRLIKLTGSAQNVSALYASLSIVMIVSVGAVMVLNGAMTIGGLACCMLLSSQLLQPIMRSLSAWNEVHLADHRRERICEIFEYADNEIKTAFAPARLAKHFNPASVSLRQVTIALGDSAAVFENCSLEAPAGSTIAITGNDNSGRSALLRAILGDIPLTSGEILINGAALSERSDRSDQPVVRYVGQHPTTFRGTILDNLTLFGSTPIPNVLWAARMIGLDSEIVRMPLGYDTMIKNISGHGVPVSTAQRICIARALACKPGLLILDEANAQLDIPGERAFAAALRNLHGRLTILIATHRPSIISLADETFVVAERALQPYMKAPVTKAAN